MTDQPQSAAAEAAMMSNENLIDMLLGAALFVLAAKSNGDDAALAEHEHRMTIFRAELESRLAAAAPPSGQVVLTEFFARSVLLDLQEFAKTRRGKAVSAQIRADYLTQQIAALKGASE